MLTLLSWMGWTRFWKLCFPRFFSCAALHFRLRTASIPSKNLLFGMIGLDEWTLFDGRTNLLGDFAFSNSFLAKRFSLPPLWRVWVEKPLASPLELFSFILKKSLLGWVFLATSCWLLKTVFSCDLLWALGVVPLMVGCPGTSFKPFFPSLIGVSLGSMLWVLFSFTSLGQ